jgi:molybdenum cofactor synthesis domain-containing protein
MTEFNLLRKTELRIENIWLENANLNEIAATVADILLIERNAILVTDVQGHILTIDILKSSVDPYNIVGKKDELLRRLSTLPGVIITGETSICSDGMLGWIVINSSEARLALRRSEEMAKRILERVSKRAIVFSSGFEVASGQIKDTNSPVIAQRLQAEGYSVTSGPTISDDELLISANLRKAVDEGYGLVIITGGVGAEDKDHTVEGVLTLDPEAATPYICKFQKGNGRHKKDGVRIAVGKVSETLIIALPGPNDEVKLSLDVLLKNLTSNVSKHTLAEDIADNLRKRLGEKMDQ